jgi:hypothetical protein
MRGKMGRKIYRTKIGTYYIKLKSGRAKFVRKPGRKRKRRSYRKKSGFWRRFYR